MTKLSSKKLFLTSLLAVVVAFALLFAFGQARIQKAYADPELPTLDNVAVDENGVLSWSPYAGDTPTCWGYGVDFADDFFILNNNATTFDLKTQALKYHLETGTYAYSVKAIEVSNYEDWEYEADVTSASAGTYAFTNTQTPLLAPTNLQWNGTTISWTASASENIGSYRIYLYETNGNVLVYEASKSKTTLSVDLYQRMGANTSYYFGVQTVTQWNGDIEHKDSVIATSATTIINSNKKISNCTIDEQGSVNMDAIEGASKYQFALYLHSGDKRLVRGIPDQTSMPFALGQYLTDHASDSTPLDGTYDILIRVYDENNVPLTKSLLITDWTLGNTYTQPAEAAGLSAGAIVGIVLGGVVVLGAIGFCLYWFILRKKN